MLRLDLFTQGDITLVRSSDKGRWAFATGPSFPLFSNTAGFPRPHDGATFFRTDLDSWYTWNEATAAWVIVGGGSGSLTVQQVEGGIPTSTTPGVEILDFNRDTGLGVSSVGILGNEVLIALNDFTPSGLGHRGGGVPDPGAVAGTSLFLREDATWASPGGAGAVPLGGIIMWSGTIATIPADYALCDGTLNAPGPDLRDKFVVGATQDDAGVAKTNIEGALSQTGGVSGHSHSGHANLVHAGITIGDHTGLTHGLTIANHPDLTHAALSHAASTFSHADHSVPSFSHTHAAVSHANILVSSFSGATIGVVMPSGTFTIASGTHSHASSAVGQASLTLSLSSTGTARTIMTGSSVTVPSHTGTHASQTGSFAGALGAADSHTHAASTITIADHPTFTGSHPATTLAHADHSFPSLSHQAIGTHVGTDYGVHTFTAPAAHGAAGTLAHSFSQPNDHAISAHDTVLSLPNYFALAFIQRMV